MLVFLVVFNVFVTYRTEMVLRDLLFVSLTEMIETDKRC